MSGINLCFILCFTGRLNAAEGSAVLCNNTNTATAVGKLTPTHSSRHFFSAQRERHLSPECAGASPAAKKLIKRFLFFLFLPPTPRGSNCFVVLQDGKSRPHALGAPEEVLIRAPSANGTCQDRDTVSGPSLGCIHEAKIHSKNHHTDCSSDDDDLCHSAGLLYQPSLLLHCRRV